MCKPHRRGKQKGIMWIKQSKYYSLFDKHFCVLPASERLSFAFLAYFVLLSVPLEWLSWWHWLKKPHKMWLTKSCTDTIKHLFIKLKYLNYRKSKVECSNVKQKPEQVIMSCITPQGLWTLNNKKKIFWITKFYIIKE